MFDHFELTLSRNFAKYTLIEACMNVDVKRFKNVTTNDRYISLEKKYKIESKGSFEFG